MTAGRHVDAQRRVQIRSENFSLLDILSTDASDFPNLVEFLLEGFLQMHPLAPFRHIMFNARVYAFCSDR